MKIWGKNVKKCEFQIDWHSVEEMPIHHSKEDLTEDEILEVSSYMENDIMATYELFKIALGKTTNLLYKDKNLIELRIDIKDEFDIDCISMSDIEIGELLIKKKYAEGIHLDINKLPYKGTFRKKVKLKECIPEYISFKTSYFQNLLKDVKSKTIGQKDPFEIEIEHIGRKYILAKGGLHADQENEVWKATEDYIIEDWDVASYYPKIIINNNIYPQHLGPELLNTYKNQYNKRVELKPLAKKDKKAKAIVEAIKLMLNIIFGKMGSMESWLYDAKALFSVTLAGEFGLLMLIEEFGLNNIQIISGNTDGITLRYHKSKEDLVKKIIKDWESLTDFQMESQRFKKFYYINVNSYWGITDDDEVKKKGDALTDFELHKNKSSRVVPLALEEYFTKGTDPIQFIENHKNIYDFCIMSRATGKLHLELQKYGKYEVTEKMLLDDGWNIGKYGWVYNYKDVWTEEGEKEVSHSFTEAKELYLKSHPLQTIQLKKLVRYYISTDSNWELYKRGIGKTDKPMNKQERAPNDLGKQYIQYFNQFEEKEDYKIDYKQYIIKALKIIDGIEKTRRTQEFINDNKSVKQMQLF